MSENPVAREARLRPEFAGLYPGVEPEAWYTAATLAEQLLARYIRRDVDEHVAPSRILAPEHFEFRGTTGMVGGRIILGP